MTHRTPSLLVAIAFVPRAAAEDELVSAVRSLLTADSRYGSSSSTVKLATRRLGAAMEDLDAARRKPLPRARMRWDPAAILWVLGALTGALVLWALAGAGLAYIAMLLGWL